MKCYYCENFEYGWCKWYGEILSEAVIEDDTNCPGQDDVVMAWNDTTD